PPDAKLNNSDPEWSGEGKTIYVTAIRKPDAEYLNNDSEIYAIDLKTLNATALTTRKGPDPTPTVSPDGKWIAYTGYDDKNFTSHLANLYLMDSAGGSKHQLAGALNNSPAELTWAADHSGVYFTVAEKGSTTVDVASSKGDVRRVTDAAHMLGSVSIAANGH